MRRSVNVAVLVTSLSLLALAGCSELPVQGVDLEEEASASFGAEGIEGQNALAAVKSVSEVLWFDTGLPVEGAFSTLLRNRSGLQMTLHTSGLTPGDGVTIWFVIFNYPEECENPTAVSACSGGDLGIEGVEGSVAHAAGHFIGGRGTGRFAGHLRTGDTSRALFGPGVINVDGAEVHLIVRSHGPRVPGIANDQIHTVDGGCSDDPEEDVCHSPQFSVHEPL
jgi:hypothetical protein